MVLPYINMNLPQVYPCSPSWTLLPPCTLPLGHPSAPAPSIQYRASNLDWRLVSYMILYMFQCHSLKSSHPLPLPQSPKDCSTHQCLFCCLVYRVIVFIIKPSVSIVITFLGFHINRMVQHIFFYLISFTYHLTFTIQLYCCLFQ